jgi:TonB family protein
MPQFIKVTGNELKDYLANTLQYPEKSREKGMEGRAVIDFTVTKTGRISNVKINKSSGVSELDQEALRVVRNMPDWKPGIAHNRKVDVVYKLPISFKLD